MKKLLLLMLAGFLSPTLAKGQNAIILQMKDGSKNVVSLEAPSSGTDPSITFDGSEMVITGGKTLRVKLSDVLRYTYGDASTGIQEIGDATPGILFQNGEIVFTNQTEGMHAEIYNAGGLLIRSFATTSPSGRAKSSVRKKMAQVLPSPSLILLIIVRIVIRAGTSFQDDLQGPRTRGPCNFSFRISGFIQRCPAGTARSLPGRTSRPVSGRFRPSRAS